MAPRVKQKAEIGKAEIEVFVGCWLEDEGNKGSDRGGVGLERRQNVVFEQARA
jgi:hypothetical protein